MQHFIQVGSTVIGVAQSLVLPKNLSLTQSNYPGIRFKITSMVLDKSLIKQVWHSTDTTNSLYISQKQPLRILSKNDKESIYYFSNCWVIDSEGTAFEQENKLITPLVKVECETVYTKRMLALKAFW